MNILKCLETWFAQQCNGDWEHGYGIQINTLDNPGWSIEINLVDTELACREFSLLKIDRSENDWIHCSTEGGFFKGYGGLVNLEEILNCFCKWAQIGS